MGLLGRNEIGGGKCVRKMDLEYRVVMPPPPRVIIKTITGHIVGSPSLLLCHISFCQLNFPAM